MDTKTFFADWSDEVEYFKEDRLLEEVTVTRGLASHAVDGSRFLLWHEIVRSDGGDSTRPHR